MLLWWQERREGFRVLLCNLDFEKAYDHVNWEFLDFMMLKMGSGEKWRRWIKFCISTTRFYVVVNGSPCGIRWIKRVEKLLAGWQKRYLSKGGKEVLIKSILLAFQHTSCLFYRLWAKWLIVWKDYNVTFFGTQQKTLGRIILWFGELCGCGKIWYVGWRTRNIVTPFGCCLWRSIMIFVDISFKVPKRDDSPPNW